MPTFKLTRLAAADVDGVGAYTLKTWGEAQAIRYLTDLDETFAALAHVPSLGRSRDDLRPGLLSCNCGKHVVFFRRDEHGNAEILRVLHERMDFARHV